MKAAIAALILAMATAACPQAANPQTAIAKGIVEKLAAGDFKGAAEPFNADVAAHVPPEALKQIWSGIEASLGKFQKIESLRMEKGAAVARCRFATQDIDMRLGIGPDGKVAGIYFSKVNRDEPLPDYVRKDSFKELEAVVGEMKLPGTLSMPLGEGPFPALVLVHGSGPNDRDESIGTAKPFRDIAWGLASQGVAVLRYDKRTLRKPDAFKGQFTVKEETVDDALAAVELLRRTPGVDAKRVFVLGHSLGGMLLPRIARSDASLAGFIFLAAPSTPLEDLFLEQCESQARAIEGHDDLKKAQIDAIRKQVEFVKSAELSKETPSEGLLLGLPASYWLDLRGYEPAKEAASIKAPLLLLQGKADRQVPMRDFEMFKSALAGRKEASFMAFPKLGHLFIVEGAGANVDKEAINGIASWLKGNP